MTVKVGDLLGWKYMDKISGFGIVVGLNAPRNDVWRVEWYDWTRRQSSTSYALSYEIERWKKDLLDEYERSSIG